MKRYGPLREFSSGYYSVDLRVVPGGEKIAVSRNFRTFVLESVFGDSESPILMRPDFDASGHLRVGSDLEVENGEVSIPHNIALDLGLAEAESEPHTFYVAKPEQARRIFQSQSLEEKFLGDST